MAHRRALPPPTWNETPRRQRRSQKRAAMRRTQADARTPTVLAGNGRRGRLLCRVCELLLIQELEIDRIEVDGRKTRPRDRVGDGLPDIGKQHIRTMDAHDRLNIGHRDAPNLEHAALSRLD